MTEQDMSVDVFEDRIQVRIFTLADHGAGEASGKLYLNGAGIDWLAVPDPPQTLPTVYMVIRLAFPWRMTSDKHTISVRLLDTDRNPVGPDPLLSAQAELGRAPGARPGDEFAINIAVGVSGYPLQNVRADSTLVFHLSVDDVLLGRLPLKLRRLELQPGLA